MRIKNILMTLALCSLVSSGAWAAGKPAEKSYKKMRYGMAGCGVGAKFIDKNQMLPQIGAWFVNQISANQTFAITTGSSNCTDNPSSSEARMEQEVFVTSNLASLSREAAQGGGDTLVALAQVLGCEESSFSKLSQDRYKDLYLGSDAKNVLDNYSREIKASGLAGSCERVI